MSHSEKVLEAKSRVLEAAMEYEGVSALSYAEDVCALAADLRMLVRDTCPTCRGRGLVWDDASVTAFGGGVLRGGDVPCPAGCDNGRRK